MQNSLANVRKHIEKADRFKQANLKEGAVKELRKANDMLDACAQKIMGHLTIAKEANSLDEKIEIIAKFAEQVEECIRLGEVLKNKIDEVVQWQP